MPAEKRDSQGQPKPRGGGRGGGGRGGGRGGFGGGPRRDQAPREVIRNAFTPMFEQFRDELDMHHDRRERIVKGSRDITALSKKIIFSLQRVRRIHPDLPQDVSYDVQDRLAEISRLFGTIAADLQGMNRYRYARNLFGAEELVEALTFAHYLRTQRLLGYDEAVAKVAGLCRRAAVAAAAAEGGGEAEVEGGGAGGAGGDSDAVMTDAADAKAVEAVEKQQQKSKTTQEARDDVIDALTVGLTPDDYLNGVFDLSGEMMRFATTVAALRGELAAATSAVQEEEGTQEDHPRTILADMQELGSLFEMLPQQQHKSYQMKLSTLRTSVLKVEKLGYGLKVRGSERPKGWMPETEGDGPVDGDE